MAGLVDPVERVTYVFYHPPSGYLDRECAISKRCYVYSLDVSGENHQWSIMKPFVEAIPMLYMLLNMQSVGRIMRNQVMRLDPVSAMGHQLGL